MPGTLVRSAIRFFTDELHRQIVGILGKRHEKIEGEFVAVGLIHSEEILIGPQEAPDLAGYTEFFGDFTLKRHPRRLSRFDPPARDEPEIVRSHAHQKDMTIADDDRANAVVETPRTHVEHNHRALPFHGLPSAADLQCTASPPPRPLLGGYAGNSVEE